MTPTCASFSRKKVQLESLFTLSAVAVAGLATTMAPTAPLGSKQLGMNVDAAVSNQTVARGMQADAYLRHQQRLREISQGARRASLGDKWRQGPLASKPVYTHLRQNLKRAQLQNERYDTIERENRILLDKMSSLFNPASVIDPTEGTWEFSPGVRLNRFQVPVIDHGISTSPQMPQRGAAREPESLNQLGRPPSRARANHQREPRHRQSHPGAVVALSVRAVAEPLARARPAPAAHPAARDDPRPPHPLSTQHCALVCLVWRLVVERHARLRQSTQEIARAADGGGAVDKAAQGMYGGRNDAAPWRHLRLWPGQHSDRAAW